MKIANNEVPDDLFLLYVHSLVEKDIKKENIIIKHIHNYISTSIDNKIPIDIITESLRKNAENIVSDPNFDKSKTLKEIMR